MENFIFVQSQANISLKLLKSAGVMKREYQSETV